MTPCDEPDFTGWTKVEEMPVDLRMNDVPVDAGTRAVYHHPKYPSPDGVKVVRVFRNNIRVVQWGLENDEPHWATAVCDGNEWCMLEKNEKIVLKIFALTMQGGVKYVVAIGISTKPTHEEHWDVELVRS